MNKILIISDNKEQSVRMKSVLANKQYSILIAKGGLDGIKLIDKKKPDLLITEILMKEVNGFEIITHIRNLKYEIKVIAMTSDGIIEADEYLKAIKALGADMVIKKPFRDGYLTNMVRSLLNKDFNDLDIMPIN